MTEQTPLSLDQLLVDFNNTVAARRPSEAEEQRLRYEARDKWKQLSATRERMLDTLLEERGLAICSQASFHLSPEKFLRIHITDKITDEPTLDLEEIKKLSPNELGIYPKDQMRLHFSRFTHSSGADPWMREEHQHDELKVLCPEHYSPMNREGPHSYAQERNRQGEFDLESEVVEKDGRLVTKVGDVDVTELPRERRVAEMVYRYFDFPALPPKPEI